MEKNLIKREVYTFYEKTDKVIKEYNFWKTPHKMWKIVKTIYDVNGEGETRDMLLPEEVLNKMLTDTAKENLNDG